MRLFTILFFPFVAFGQNEIGFDPIDFNYINFVIDDKEASKSERFVEGVLWVTENFKSYNNVVSYQNKEEGIIIGSDNIRIEFNCRICGASGIHKTYAGWVSYTFKLEFFDDGYSYELTTSFIKRNTAVVNLEIQNRMRVNF